MSRLIWRRGQGLKSQPTDWRSRESSLRPMVYKASGLSTTPSSKLACGVRMKIETPYLPTAVGDNYGGVLLERWPCHIDPLQGRTLEL